MSQVSASCERGYSGGQRLIACAPRAASAVCRQLPHPRTAICSQFCFVGMNFESVAERKRGTSGDHGLIGILPSRPPPFTITPLQALRKPTMRDAQGESVLARMRGRYSIVAEGCRRACYFYGAQCKISRPRTESTPTPPSIGCQKMSCQAIQQRTEQRREGLRSKRNRTGGIAQGAILSSGNANRLQRKKITGSQS